MDVDEALEHEKMLMGRDVDYRNMFESTFRNGADGAEHTVTFLIYNTGIYPYPAHPEAIQFTQEQTRFAVFVDGEAETGGIIAVKTTL